MEREQDGLCKFISLHDCATRQQEELNGGSLPTREEDKEIPDFPNITEAYLNDLHEYLSEDYSNANYRRTCWTGPGGVEWGYEYSEALTDAIFEFNIGYCED